ncbi:hypothetical protein KCV26_14855 [Petrimonas sulfuriphila]|jgi:hypothetical protein|uniref:hypothetical protein n=1 Tax=Petrimonas TaxID=307628 RepID=UPI002B3ACDCF|nr:hypothetical protein [Petrimonas sp.]MEA5070945.1 hypothetical protein [Petrimonas sp.]
MKRNFFTSLLAVVLFLGVAFGAASCSKNDGIAETQWKVINITVKKSDWVWNNNDGFYQATVNLPELTQFIFDEGAAIGYYKFNNDSKTALPFVKTYAYDIIENGVTVTKFYTETISCDFNLGSPSSVVFTLEMSDLAFYEDGVPVDMNFQVVLIW